MSIEPHTRSADVVLKPGVDWVFEALGSRERRTLLLELRDGRIDHESDVVAHGGDRAKVQLRHTHLPKLSQMDVIEWDRETGEIAKGPRFEAVEALLSLLTARQDDLPEAWP